MLERTKIVPHTNEIVRLLSGLFGRAVTAKLGKPLDLKMPQKLFWGIYSCDHQDRRVLCAFDLPLAAYSGAALLLFPASRANQSVTKGELEDALNDDLREVLNVLSQVLNAPGGPHFRLQTLLTQRGSWPSELGTQAAVLKSDRIDLEITLAGYGTGKLIMLEL